MNDPATGNWIVYNGGGSTTFRKVRAKLERHTVHFSGHSDTEVILKAYGHWGEKVSRRISWNVCLRNLGTRKRPSPVRGLADANGNQAALLPLVGPLLSFSLPRSALFWETGPCAARNRFRGPCELSHFWVALRSENTLIEGSKFTSARMLSHLGGRDR